MSRDEVIKLLALIRSTVYLGNRKFFDALESAISYLRQPEQRWIPCSERLPEEYGEYLITWTTSQEKHSYIALCEGEVTSEYDYEHERFVFEWLPEDYIKAYPDVVVIAWMPLPNQYKAESEDKK